EHPALLDRDDGMVRRWGEPERAALVGGHVQGVGIGLPGLHDAVEEGPDLRPVGLGRGTDLHAPEGTAARPGTMPGPPGAVVPTTRPTIGRPARQVDCDP